jgi:hypothetical protein
MMPAADDAEIQAAIAKWPPLTAEQRATLAHLFDCEPPPTPAPFGKD